MEIALHNQKKENIGKVDLNDKVFNTKFNSNSVFQVYTSMITSRRQPVAHSKDRSEVRGGGKKPWAQKGTGRARAGSTRSPIWRHGGVTFGPRQAEMNFNRKVNQKAKNKALAMVISKKIKDNEFFIIDQITLDKGKTKEMNLVASRFAKDNFKKTNKALYLILPEANKDLIRFTRNLPFAFATTISSVDLVDLLNYKHIAILKDAVATLEKRLVTKK